MPWWSAGIIANICIMWVEYLNRTGNYGSFLATLPYTVVFIAVAQWGLYYSWASAPTMLSAWCTFTIGNSVFRVISGKFLIHETISWYHIAGIAVMFGGAMLIKIGK